MRSRLILLTSLTLFYSNVSRGRRQKEKADGLIPGVLEAEENAQTNGAELRMPLPGPFFFRSLSCLPAFGPIFLLDRVFSSP